ncbi:MAG: Hsp70 family protein [Spirochaetota bacterium]
MAKYCGIDFGTSNSVVTILGDTDETPRVVREPSLMYFADDPESTARRHCGRAALERYVHGGMNGRFFQSVKSILPDAGFTRTSINGKPFSVEDLVAVMLRYLRDLACDLAGSDVRQAVIGRPARFSDDPAREALAQERLARAVAQAGFENVEYVFEPVAGARAYTACFAGGVPWATQRTGVAEDAAHGNTGSLTVFVADHGGGTSDFTVMRLAIDRSGRPAAQEILGTHGIRAGGDDFDGAIMWNRLVDQFGHGSHYESFDRMLPVPVHIYHIISHWDQIHFLKTLSYREELRTYLRSSDNPLAIRRLIKLVEENLGYFVFQAIERAKIELSSQAESVVAYERDKLRIHEPVSRSQFETYIADYVARIDAAVEQTMSTVPARAGTGPQVDAVFVTGGSGRVPAIREVLARRFGAERIIDDADRFQSVGLGLALVARDRGLAN